MQIYDENDNTDRDNDTSSTSTMSSSEASSVFPRVKRADSPMPHIDTRYYVQKMIEKIHNTMYSGG